VTAAVSPATRNVGRAAATSRLRRHIPALVLLVGATALTFWPSLHHGFVEWDDIKNLVENTQYRGLGWSQIRWAFTNFENGHYMPLVWLSWDVDYLIWGTRPFGFHLTNLILHCLNACLVYALAVDLLGRAFPERNRPAGGLLNLRIAALLAALVFALHPLRVESVAWVTERKDLLSSFFYLLTVVLYLHQDGRRWGWPAVTYLLAVLSKVMVVSLPVVLLVLDVYPLRRLGGPRGWLGRDARRVYAQKLPFVLMAAAVAVVAPIAQHHVVSMTPWDVHGLLPRLAVCAYGLGFYVWKTVVPTGLSPLYELRIPINPFARPFVLAGVVVVAVAATSFLLRRRVPSLWAAGLCYAVILAPVLGLVQNGPQLVADRYSYLATLPWVLLLWGALLRVGGQGLAFRVPIVLASATAVVALGLLSVHQSRHWRDTRSLWAQALRVDPDCAFCHNAMGRALAEEDPAQAEHQYREALRINPTQADAHNNLGILLMDQGHPEQALRHLFQAVALEPDNGTMHYNLANALGRLGRVDEALEQYERAAAAPRWKPPPTLFNNWAYLLITKGLFAEAAEKARVAVRMDPAYAEAHYNLGVALLRSGRQEEAVASFAASIRCRPDEPDAYLYAARELARAGLREQAEEILRTAVERFPDNPVLSVELSRLLSNRT
jgi:tetratricopeptide (TPR) repeat protein